MITALQRTRIKMCGLTSLAHVHCASALGVDAIGLVFYEKSRRFIPLELAAKLAAAAGPFMTVTALFMNADQRYIAQVLQRVTIDLLQFHGDEPATLCRSFDKPYIKSIAMGDQDASLQSDRIGECIAEHPEAAGFLLDGHQSGQPGGSGERFNWREVPKLDVPIVLAGGLNAQNVAESVMLVRPYAVDVSSGIEHNTEKDTSLMRAFVQSVANIDHKLYV